MNEGSKSLRSYGDWELVKCLGVGAFGEVHHWRNRQTMKEIATKRLKYNAKLMPDETNVLCKRWIQEEKWMKSLQTPYIVRAVDISDQDFLKYLVSQNPSIGYTLPVIVMEYCNGGDLRSNLNKVINLNGLMEYEVRNIFRALVQAIKYLHETCQIEHRDIKPENIVCHTKGKKKIYKLSDFGYAREIPENTIAQSVVGTRNYVAPEVIDGGTYTKTVDYFSIGNVIYEIICGTQPFIPHQKIYTRIKYIQKKPLDCIAIVQKINNQNEDNFEFINYILPQNHSSYIFINYMEEWLRSVLMNDYKTRGCNKNNELIFYTDAEKILATKIVTVFSLKTYKKYYYNIESFVNLQEFIITICNDNNIEKDNIFVIYPPLHPKKNGQNPEDYFVPEWCDTGNPDNPPVMLFIDEFKKENDFDIHIDGNSYITETIKKCMSISPQFDDIPDWLLQQFEKEIHFILTNQQNLLQCYLMGLHNYVLDIEHHVLIYSSEIYNLNKIIELNGSLKHFNVVLNELITNVQVSNSAKNMGNIFTNKLRELDKQINVLKKNYQIILQNCRELATIKIYDEYAAKDIFQLSDYRKFLSKESAKEKRLDRGQTAIDKMFDEVKKLKSSECFRIRVKLNEQIVAFISLRDQLVFVKNEMNRLENEINECTRSLLKNIRNDTDELPMRMNSLRLDGTKSKSLVNNNTFLSVFDRDTEPLLNDFNSTLKSMEQLMDMN